MVIVRYAALVALVVWLGAMQTAMALPGLDRQWLEYACGSVLVAALLTMKLVGPPPHGFKMRIGLAAAMLGLAVVEYRDGILPLRLVNMCLGFVSLIWYVRE
jgi:hypothetical protein